MVYIHLIKIKVEFFHNVKTYDVIEFPQYPDSFFYLSKLNKKILMLNR